MGEFEVRSNKEKVPLSTKRYRIIKNGRTILSIIPGKYAGCRSTHIFGRVHNACARGLLMKKENRVFFHQLADAVKEGYRPCKGCRPINKQEFEAIKHLTPFTRLEDFYNSTRTQLK